MAFSATCPTFSVSQLQEEFASFTEEERQDIYRDIFGRSVGPVGERLPPLEANDKKDPSSSSSPSSSQSSSTSLTSTSDAVLEAIEGLPEGEADAYRRAQEVAPELVRTESNPDLFLLKDQGDVAAAASRLAEYWQVRLEVFGPDRAYAPMTLDGAMAEDTWFLRKGGVQILPCDIHGRSVVLWNRILQTEIAGVSRKLILRALFYLLHRLTKAESGNKRKDGGYVVVGYQKGYDLFKHFDRALVKESTRLTMVIPLIRTQAVHMCTGSGSGVIGMLIPVLNLMLTKRGRHRLVLHAGSPPEVLSSLAAYGLTKEHLPDCIGGEVSVEDFNEWLDYQGLLERNGGSSLTQDDS